MRRRRKLPPDIDPERPYCKPQRGLKQLCESCGGTTRAMKGQTLEQAVAVHAETCPAKFRINPKGKQ